MKDTKIGAGARLRAFASKKLLSKPRARRYIDPKLGVEGFFRAIGKRRVDYVVLRWFDILPRVEPGEDLDLLVADSDLDTITDYLTGSPKNGIPCDLYTSSGLPGTDFRGISYYPEPLARSILENAVLQGEYIRVPDTRHHFLSLAYHAVYHKGLASGIPTREQGPAARKPKDHDYLSELAELATRSALTPVDLTLEGLDDILGDLGWRPTRDALEKLSARNAWVHKRYFDEDDTLPVWWRGLAVFFVREHGIPYLDEIRAIIKDQSGYVIMEELPLEGSARETVTKNVRGGSWGKGAFSQSGGLPAHLLILYDCYPVEPCAETRKDNPGLTNERNLELKRKIRKHGNAGKKREEQSNIVHSTDNAAQAISVIEMVMGDSLQKIESAARAMYEAFTTPYPVIRNLCRNVRRAKVELVDYKGRRAVCKTYLPGREKYLENEARAREIGEGLPEIVPILERGPNYLVLEYIEDAKITHKSLFPLFLRHKYLPLWVTRRVREVIRHYRARGYGLIDFSASSLMVDAEQRVHLIDFEFFQPGDGPSESLVGCWAWYGIPDSLTVNKPLFRAMNKNPYKVAWLSRTGIPRFIAARDFPSFVYFFFQMVMGFALIASRLLTPLARMAQKAGALLKRAAKKAVRLVLRF